MQNPYSELFLGINIFAAHFTTNLWLNIGKKTRYLTIYKLKIIQENAFSEASFRTLVWVGVEYLWPSVAAM